MSTLKVIIIGALAFGVGFGTAWYLHEMIEPHAAAGGAYFCCDRKGENCVLSGPTCNGYLRWCAETKVSDTGQVTCAEWGP